MAGALKRYDFGPIPMEVNAAVTGGQLVMPDATTGKVKPATAGALTCLGVAETDAIPTATNQNDNANDLNLSPIGAWTAVAKEGYYDMLYGGAVAAGQHVKVATGPKLVLWVSGTDVADMIVGRCIVAASADGDIRLTQIKV